ncbi:uncharacterized protein LOC106712559 isoform X1 [Papilio machaon]|uniref:uncharacterized protein LOC106712559 isoform X1 n=1 Tax=Papilio machaon TaxID=76193 RepID=UPI001E662D54|nr:uncharacterized protein LOC106712559 isoform X1 [Papilio machaon]
MSQSPTTPRKQSKTRRLSTKLIKEDNNNTNSKHSKRQNARTFVAWYKRMIDDDRQNLALYLSDDATLEWFGRTIKTRKKVTAFLRYDMQCSRHDFRSVDCIDHIPQRYEPILRRNETALASPLENSPEICKSGPERGKKRLLRSNSNSPEWAENCGPDSDLKPTGRKRLRNNNVQLSNEDEINVKLSTEKDLHKDECLGVSNKGDFAFIKRAMKRKCCTVTPPNLEVGQGDCLPSTSGTDSDRSHDTLNAQLPRLAVECDGYIEFNRTRNHSIDSVKWERKCKVQISYSEDPLNVGEYIIWNIRYNDETKCRRNLLAAFEEIAKEEELKKNDV